MKRVTEDEWQAELARLSAKNDAGLTVDEWCAKLGRAHDYIRAMLKRARADGWLVAGKRTSTALDGRQYHANVYRIVKPKGRSTRGG